VIGPNSDFEVEFNTGTGKAEPATITEVEVGGAEFQKALAIDCETNAEKIPFRPAPHNGSLTVSSALHFFRSSSFNSILN
jgi:hypothetical protein